MQKEYIIREITGAFPEEVEKYRNLIYLPLDLPPVPEVDSVKLAKYIREHEVEVFSHINARKYGVSYPWYRTSVYLSDEPSTYNFKTEFPELVEYASLFPHSGEFGLTAVVQKQSDAFCHSDIGDWFGFRFYANAGEGENLYFKKAKVIENKNLRTYDENGYSIESRLEESKIFAKKPKNTYPWIMTNVLAAHGVENVEVTTNRIVIAVFFKIDWLKTRVLLDRSLERYSEHAIWY
ncbi:MAG: hypothetical protein ACLGGX_12255 [Bdellovibrionia bacterium]